MGGVERRERGGGLSFPCTSPGRRLGRLSPCGFRVPGLNLELEEGGREREVGEKYVGASEFSKGRVLKFLVLLLFFLSFSLDLDKNLS